MRMTERQIRDEYNSLDPVVDSHFRIAKLVRMKKCPPDVLAKVAQHEARPLSMVEARHEAQKNPRLPKNVLENMLLDLALSPGHSMIYHPLLKNPSITSLMFKKMIMTNQKVTGLAGIDSDLFKAMVSHPSCPREVLEMALKDSRSGIRTLVAKNPALTAEDVASLLWDDNYLVRRELARNKAIDPEVFRVWLNKPILRKGRLAGGQHTVIQALIRRLPAGQYKEEAIAYLKTFNNGKATKIIIARHSTKVENLEFVAYSGNKDVHDALLRNPNALDEHKVASTLASGSGI